VNHVGVNLNTASKHLLTCVSGLSSTVAKNIVDYPAKNDAFKSRDELKKITMLGFNFRELKHALFGEWKSVYARMIVNYAASKD